MLRRAMSDLINEDNIGNNQLSVKNLFLLPWTFKSSMSIIRSVIITTYPYKWLNNTVLRFARNFRIPSGAGHSRYLHNHDHLTDLDMYIHVYVIIN